MRCKYVIGGTCIVYFRGVSLITCGWEGEDFSVLDRELLTGQYGPRVGVGGPGGAFSWTTPQVISDHSIIYIYYQYSYALYICIALLV